MRKRSRILWMLLRARAMTPSEVAVRARREVRNAFHRTTRGAGRAKLPDLRSLLDRGRGGSEVSAEELVASARGRLLRCGSDPDALGRAIAGIGGSPETVVAAADRILSGWMPAYGFTEFEIGRDPDWHRDPETGRRWPDVFWADVDYRFDDEIGDPRHVWEVNRQHHLVTLARAHFLSGDPRYAEAVWDHIRSWVEQNPPYRGINWSSALELGLRLISWGMAVDLVGTTGARDGDARNLLTSAALQARHICDNLSIYASSRNNHLIGEGAGLFVIGSVFPFFSRAPRWVRTGRALLESDVLAQTSKDGVCREQTLHYQAFVLEFCLAAQAAALGSGAPLSPVLADRVGRMGTFLERTGGPRWEPPAIGDEDGGRAFDLADERGRQCARAAACAALVSGRGVPAELSEADLEPALWLFGPAAVREWLAGRGDDAAPGAAESSAYPDGGYFVPAAGGHHGVIDCGPLGYASIAAHGHADCLSLSIAAGGEWVVVDPGTYCYHRDLRWRDHFRSTEAHNTVTVDGTSQSEMLGPFIWGRRARPEQLRWASEEHFDFFEGAHDGYLTSLGVRHRRRIVFGKRGYWLVVDDLTGEGEHELAATFQLAPGMRPDESADSAIEDALSFRDGSGRGVWLRAWLPPGVSIGTVEGRDDPPGGWVSPAFGVKEAAPAVVAAGRARLPATLVFTVVPFEGARDVGVECPTGAANEGTVLETVFDGGRDVCLLGLPCVEAAGATFEGALGFVAERNGQKRLYGLDIVNWSDGERDSEFEPARNRLAGGSE
jgi:hypothetical protein